MLQKNSIGSFYLLNYKFLGGKVMRLVIQRVSEANVKINEEEISKIGKGYLVLVGIKQTDTREIAAYLINKLLNLRIFEDENNKLNLSIKDINGDLLLVSQFTLYGDCSRGNRPSFIEAAKPEYAEELYNYFVEECKKQIKIVKEGKFGSYMKINLTNDGPATIIIEK